MSLARVAVFLIGVIAIECDLADKNNELVINYLQKYGYLDNETRTFSSATEQQVFRRAIELFQEYYELPGRVRAI